MQCKITVTAELRFASNFKNRNPIVLFTVSQLVFEKQISNIILKFRVKKSGL